MGGMMQGAGAGGMEMKETQRGASLGRSRRMWRRMSTRTRTRSSRYRKRKRTKTKKRARTRAWAWACRRRGTSTRTWTPAPHAQAQTRSAGARGYAASAWARASQSRARARRRVHKVCTVHRRVLDPPVRRADGASISRSSGCGSGGARGTPTVQTGQHTRLGARWMRMTLGRRGWAPAEVGMGTTSARMWVPCATRVWGAWQMGRGWAGLRRVLLVASLGGYRVSCARGWYVLQSRTREALDK
ncbi:hypothetical protein JB92DRAFT_3032001 [Gautieria morchelliformis]|nr:hypothetical protein JB92DRAFT_3032001 [Gautieria morchelliformis]